METQMTIRLPAELTSKIKEKARHLRLKRSDIVRQALIAYLEGSGEIERPYEQVKHLIGSISTSDRVMQKRESLIQKIREHNFRG